MRQAELNIAGQRIGVLPFEVWDRVLPRPPQFGSFLQQALLQEATTERVEYILAAPWDDLLVWQRKDLGEVERVQLAATEGSSRDFNLVVLGRVDVIYRTASRGLVAKITLWLISAEDGRVLWYGRKSAKWRKHLAMEDCLFHLARSFVAEWRLEKKKGRGSPGSRGGAEAATDVLRGESMTQ